ncbi:MAG TPA: arginine deiminase family protein [Steroidobacteraceae bacterium]|jgi:dimethylargininase|nr:arginine deiminase family protein [Steroidobacteraceae bacterium]
MRFTRAIVRLPGENFSQGLTISGPESGPDVRIALEQHAAYCSALEGCGLEVTVMAADAAHPDGTFVEDTFVIADRVAIATRPGARTRTGEVASVAAALRPFRPHWARIESPGTVDGGDICQAGNHFLIGLSARTNEAGAAQLAAILAGHQYTASTIDIRHHPSLLHLKSGITYLGEHRFLIAAGFPPFRALADYDRIEVAADEAYAANSVRVNDDVLVAAGFPRLAGELEKLGYRVRPLHMSEFAKMDGGLSCLSLRF